MIDDYYTQDATIYSIVETINELGPDETSDVFTEVCNIQCALETMGKAERFIDGTNITFGSHRMYCAKSSTTIQENYILRIGTDDYDIKAVSNPMERNHHIEVVVELRT